MLVRHRPWVTHALEDTPEGEAVVHRARCTCEAALPDLEEHLEQVAPPPARRCREPRRHRCQPHDRCALCADQLCLPGLEQLEVA